MKVEGSPTSEQCHTKRKEDANDMENTAKMGELKSFKWIHKRSNNGKLCIGSQHM